MFKALTQHSLLCECTPSMQLDSSSLHICTCPALVTNLTFKASYDTILSSKEVLTTPVDVTAYKLQLQSAAWQHHNETSHWPA